MNSDRYDNSAGSQAFENLQKQDNTMSLWLLRLIRVKQDFGWIRLERYVAAIQI